MTPDHLRRLSELATPGPWRVEQYGDGDSLVIHDARGDWRVCFMATPGSDGDMRRIEANAELIVEMRNSLPQLLARITALEAALEPFAKASKFIERRHDPLFRCGDVAVMSEHFARAQSALQSGSEVRGE